MTMPKRPKAAADPKRKRAERKLLARLEQQAAARNMLRPRQFPREP